MFVVCGVGAVNEKDLDTITDTSCEGEPGQER